MVIWSWCSICYLVNNSYIYKGYNLSFLFILSAGANINSRDVDGDCPLHICEDPAIAEFLLSNGADETLVNNDGLSVYQQALELENEEMVMFWAKRLGIDMTIQTTEQEQGGEMEGIAEEEEESSMEVSGDHVVQSEPVVYPPGTVITPGEPLPEPMRKT